MWFTCSEKWHVDVPWLHTTQSCSQLFTTLRETKIPKLNSKQAVGSNWLQFSISSWLSAYSGTYIKESLRDWICYFILVRYLLILYKKYKTYYPKIWKKKFLNFSKRETRQENVVIPVVPDLMHNRPPMFRDLSPDPISPFISNFGLDSLILLV